MLKMITINVPTIRGIRSNIVSFF